MMSSATPSAQAETAGPAEPIPGERFRGWLTTDQTLEIARKCRTGAHVRTWSKEQDAPGLHVRVSLEALEYWLRLSEQTGGPNLHWVDVSADLFGAYVS
jgi:hypothetical protein